jgi:hypothetical protein
VKEEISAKRKEPIVNKVPGKLSTPCSDIYNKSLMIVGSV